MTRRVLSFHYTLTNKEGKIIDTSREKDPFPVLEGAKQIIPGLEEEIFKMEVGDKKKIEVPADKAYGQVNDALKIKVTRDKLPEGELNIGTMFRGGPEPDAPIFTVKMVEGDDVHLDGNHPLAGQDLTFDVEVTEIKEASKEELEHGHAHGPHGHDHGPEEGHAH